MERAGQRAGHRKRAEIEEFDDVGDRERLRVNGQIKNRVAFARAPFGRAADVHPRAVCLSDGQRCKRHFPRVGGSRDHNAAGAKTGNREFEIDHGDGAVDRIVCRIDGEIESW